MGFWGAAVVQFVCVGPRCRDFLCTTLERFPYCTVNIPHFEETKARWNARWKNPCARRHRSIRTEGEKSGGLRYLSCVTSCVGCGPSESRNSSCTRSHKFPILCELIQLKRIRQLPQLKVFLYTQHHRLVLVWPIDSYRSNHFIPRHFVTFHPLFGLVPHALGFFSTCQTPNCSFSSSQSLDVDGFLFWRCLGFFQVIGISDEVNNIVVDKGFFFF